MKKQSFWLVLFALIIMLTAGGCGGGGGGGGGGAAGSINGTWKILSIIDSSHGGFMNVSSSGVTVAVTRNSETGEIKLSGNSVRYNDTYPQGYIEISGTNGSTYLMRGVPSSTLEDEDKYGDSVPDSVKLEVCTYSAPSGNQIVFTYLTGMGETLDYEVWGYKIGFIR